MSTYFGRRRSRFLAGAWVTMLSTGLGVCFAMGAGETRLIITGLALDVVGIFSIGLPFLRRALRWRKREALDSAEWSLDLARQRAFTDRFPRYALNIDENDAPLAYDGLARAEEKHGEVERHFYPADDELGDFVLFGTTLAIAGFALQAAGQLV